MEKPEAALIEALDLCKAIAIQTVRECSGRPYREPFSWGQALAAVVAILALGAGCGLMAADVFEVLHTLDGQ